MRPRSGAVHGHRGIGDPLELGRLDRVGATRNDPPENAPHVGIDGAHGHPKRQRRDGTSRVAPDARQGFEGDEVGRDLATMHLDDSPRGAPQVQCPSVVAEAAPCTQHVGRGGRCRRGGRWKGVHEPDTGLAGPGRLRLLGHHLRHEDRVRVERLAEWEAAAVRRIPVEDRVARLGLEREIDGHAVTIPGAGRNRSSLARQLLSISAAIPSVGAQSHDGRYVLA